MRPARASLVGSLSALLLLLSVLPTPAEAVKVDKTINVASEYYVFYHFGFQKGGSGSLDVHWDVRHGTHCASLHSHMDPATNKTVMLPSSHLLVCSQTERFQQYQQQHTDLCNLAPFTRANSGCLVVQQLNSENVHVEFNITKPDTYDFLLTNCEGCSLHFHVRGVLVNPGGQHLTASEIPLPSVFAVLAALWVAALAVWALNWLFHRHLSNRLHLLISCVPVCGCLFALFAMLFWQDSSKSGEARQFLSIAYHLAIGLHAFFISLVLLLISDGYGVTRPSVGAMELRISIFFSFCLSACLVLFEFVGSYFVFLLLLMFGIVVKTIFSNIATTIALLEDRVQTLRDAGYDRTQVLFRVVKAKLRAYRRLYSAVLAYALVQFILLLLGVIAFNLPSWVTMAAREGLVLALFVVIAVMFRLRSSMGVPGGDRSAGGDDDSGRATDDDVESRAPPALVLQYPSKAGSFPRVALAVRSDKERERPYV